METWIWYWWCGGEMFDVEPSRCPRFPGLWLRDSLWLCVRRTTCNYLVWCPQSPLRCSHHCNNTHTAQQIGTPVTSTKYWIRYLNLDKLSSNSISSIYASVCRHVCLFFPLTVSAAVSMKWCCSALCSLPHHICPTQKQHQMKYFHHNRFLCAPGVWPKLHFPSFPVISQAASPGSNWISQQAFISRSGSRAGPWWRYLIIADLV